MRRFRTPPIPKWIRDLRCDGYCNIFELGLGNRNLFGTETLFGDWDGPLLIVAKDFAPAASIRRRAERVPRERVYHHHDGSSDYEPGGMKTNRRLVRFSFAGESEEERRAILRGERNCERGALYMSACFLLKDTDHYSAGLSGWSPGRPAFEQSRRVFDFVIDHMPNLKAVACLGRDAERLVEHAGAGDAVRRYIPHPSRGSNAAQVQGWAGLYEDAGLCVRDGRVVGGKGR